MAPRLANEVREVGTPTHCSACFNQNPQVRHIDFDAACDRGYGNSEAVKVQLDDLILCETCLRSGAALVDMVDATELAERIATLESRMAAEVKRADQAVGYANRMEQALAARPAPVKVSRPRGRPKAPLQSVGV
jgi:hypothetical protein